MVVSKKQKFQGTVTTVSLKINQGAKYNTPLAFLQPGTGYKDYRYSQMIVGFEADDGPYWFHAPQVNIPPIGRSPETSWLTSGSQDEPPKPKIAVDELITVSARIKKENTSHGTQLFHTILLDNVSAPTQDRVALLEERIAALEDRVAALE